jgi:hypothetical protein
MLDPQTKKVDFTEEIFSHALKADELLPEHVYAAIR